MYSVCGRIDEARRLFDDWSCNDVSRTVWEAMLIACSRNCRAEEALLLYSEMLHRSVLPGNFAFSSVLKACFELSELRLGRAVHAQIVKSEEVADQVVNNALLRLYAGGNGCSADAHQMFDVMPDRNVVSWNSLLAGLAQDGRLAECLELFRRMQLERVGFSWVTFTIILPVCARVTALCCGQEIHAHLIKAIAEPDIPVSNSLMDMYAKCGFVEFSRNVFDKMIDRDLTTWNTMLTGYAVNGRASDGLKLFEEMVEAGFRPDAITFIAVLSSCSHAGLTAEGQRLYNRMGKEFGVSPTVEHYACLVDLLGRAGCIKEALDVVENMPMSPGGSIWGSLLNSCRLYGNIELGEVVAKRLFELEPNNAGNYVMLSNMYASTGQWENVKKLRELMVNRGIRKEVGCSWVHIKNKVHTFVASGSVGFRQSEEYKRVWKELMEAMKEAGYALNTGVVLHDVHEEMKATWVCEHSERLAVVFALIQTGNGMPIRITKNLRICVDCHSAMKAISKVARRVIVLRDTNRFHHFVDGACSCGDYW
ncbi:hypothetical protein AAC387_Pa11g1246 [Persea americana]